MEKIININFQGRVIPIEETAYNNLKQYIDSLRAHFAKEEGNDEIINDIENRIAELFSYRLKQGVACIVNADLGSVIESIGRLEDIEAAEGKEGFVPPKLPPTPSEPIAHVKGRFFRNADDKVIAGICSAVAARMGVDPLVIRILFVLLFGALFWIYLLLWIVVPSQSISANITRRLYRNPDDKVVAGVCGGLATYFRMDSRMVRLIFLLPFLIGFITRGLFNFMWHWHGGIGQHIFIGSFGSTFFILYLILWIAVPYASSATDMLEMRGEKVDMNSIKAAASSKSAYGNQRPVRYSGIGRVIAILFKSFFLFIAGVIAVSFFGVFIGLVFTGLVAIPFTNFVLDGWGQYVLAWTGIILFLGIPFLAFVTWGVRRLIGVRSQRHYLGYIFTMLWLTGLISLVILFGVFMKNFNSRAMVEDAVTINQPSINKLYIDVDRNIGLTTGSSMHYRYENWSWNGNGSPLHVVNKDSLWLNTVKVKVAQSTDSQYHIYEERISRGETSDEARTLASHIPFNITQQDTTIKLPGGFTVSNKDKFRNQQVLIVVEVPVGKEVILSRNIDNYDWFTVNVTKQRNFYVERHWERGNNYRSGGKYLMTGSGLQNTGYTEHAPTKDDEDNDNDEDDD